MQRISQGHSGLLPLVWGQFLFIFTFNKVLEELKTSVFLVEETKLKDAGRIKVENYVVFKKVRENRDGGALGCVNDLKPVWVREGE